MITFSISTEIHARCVWCLSDPPHPPSNPQGWDLQHSLPEGVGGGGGLEHAAKCPPGVEVG